MPNRLLPSLLAFAALALIGAVALIPSLPAEAQGRLRAQAYITQQRIPRGLTEQGLIRFARGHQSRRLSETTSQPIRQRKWRANLVVAFNRPIGDLQFQVLFYDLDDGRRFVAPALDVFLSDRNEKTFLQPLRLERPHFRPNRDMEMVVLVRRREITRRRFTLVGAAPRNSGNVDFAAP